MDIIMDQEIKKLPQHSELPIAMTWDLSPMYKTIADWETDFTALDQLEKTFITYKGRLAESAQILREAIEASDALERLAEKIYVYAHLKSDENTADSTNRSYVDRAAGRFAQISGSTAWFDPEIMAIDENKMSQFLASEELAFYRNSLEKLLKERSHTLSAKEERILGLSSDVMGSASKTYSMLNNADMKFPVLTDENGDQVTLTHGNYINFLESGDREVRSKAFEAMFKTYKKLRNTMASTLDATVKRHVLNANLRNYPSALEASLFSDDIPLSVYNNLIDAVHSKLPVLTDYFSLRAEVLGLDKLDMYDIYTPLVQECKVKVSWEDACKWVKAALKPLGEEYCTQLDKAFEQRWIDVNECEGKRSGAYSSGCYDSYPYILHNFTGTLSDVFTLAHELGHSMHSFYSRQAQEYHYADYTIFVAEVASTTNELLLHEYLMQQDNDDKFKAYLLCHQADQIRGTVIRQTMFAEFEKFIHEQAEQHIPLTADLLSEEYFKLNKKYHGSIVDPNQLIEMEWARIPHFYYNFYVYKYATGLAAAGQLAQNILSGDAKKLAAYLGFLKAGDSKDPLEIMLDAGVDLTTPAPVEAILDTMQVAVDELREKLGVRR
jgi:oligoendopeptidase F